MRLNRVLLAAAVLWTAAALVSEPAYGHGGGGFRDAPREIPPGSRDPNDPPPPPEPPPPPRDDWTLWWRHHQREFLARRRTRDAGRIAGDAVADVLVPRLRTLLADGMEHDYVRSAAALALAKMGDVASAAKLRELAANAGSRHPRVVQERAALALGLLPEDPQTRAILLARVLTPEQPPPSFRRPFAAIALGLLGGSPDDRRIAVRALFETVACEEPNSGVRPACLVAIGLLADESAIPELTDLVTERSAAAGAMAPLTPLERAFAIEALGRAGAARPDGAVLRALTSLVERSRVWVADDGRRSAVVVLGQVAARAGGGQRRAASLLREVSADGTVAATDRHFALVALGRLAGAPDADPRTRSEVLAYLRSSLDRSRPGDATFAAIALALAGRAMQEATGRAAEIEVRAPIRARFAGETDTDTRSAFALASGLVGDETAVRALLATLLDRSAAPVLRGWCALALGMIGDDASCAPLVDALREKADREFSVQCATALGLLGDARAVDVLVKLLADIDASIYEVAAVAIALGRIGDERTVPALLDVATDTQGRYPDLTRALAVVALGVLADRRDVPALARIAGERNYLVRDCAIEELLTIL